MTPGESFAKLSPMHYLLLFFLFINFTNAATFTGEISGCTEKGQVIAKEGDKFVTVKLSGKEWKLTGPAGKVFSRQAKEPVTFRSLDNDPMKGEPTLEFQMTSAVMSSLPRLILSYSGVQNTCKVDLYGPAHSKQN